MEANLKKDKKVTKNVAQNENVVYNGKRTISRTDDCFSRYLLALQGHEDILLSVVNSVMRNKYLKEFKSVEVKNPFNLKQQQLEQETIMDVKAVTNTNEVVLVEMQVREQEAYFDRSLDYVIRNAKILEKHIMPKNKIKKEKFVLVNPKQIIGISFLAFELYKNIDFAHTTHLLHCCETKEVSSSKICLHMLDLTKDIETIEDEELKLWFQFFYSENFEQEKKMIAQYSEIFNKAVEAYDSFVSNDECMSYAEKHMLQKMYHTQELEDREQKGARAKALETAKNLRAMGLSLEQIVQATGLMEEEVNSIKN